MTLNCTNCTGFYLYNSSINKVPDLTLYFIIGWTLGLLLIIYLFKKSAKKEAILKSKTYGDWLKEHTQIEEELNINRDTRR